MSRQASKAKTGNKKRNPDVDSDVEEEDIQENNNNNGNNSNSIEVDGEENHVANDKSNDEDDDDDDDNENSDTTTSKKGKRGRGRPSGSSRGGRGRGKRRKVGDNRYRIYIFKILQQVHPKIGITKTGMDILNSFVEDMFEKICNEAMKLCTFHKTSTITKREICTAAKLILPGELRKHAIMEGEKAVSTYVRNYKDLKEKRQALMGDKKGVFKGNLKKGKK